MRTGTLVRNPDGMACLVLANVDNGNLVLTDLDATILGGETPDRVTVEAEWDQPRAIEAQEHFVLTAALDVPDPHLAAFVVELLGQGLGQEVTL